MSYIRLSYDETTLIEFNGLKLKMNPFLPHLKRHTSFPHIENPRFSLPSSLFLSLFPSSPVRRPGLLLPLTDADQQHTHPPLLHHCLHACPHLLPWVLPHQQLRHKLSGSHCWAAWLPHHHNNHLQSYLKLKGPSMVIEVIHKLFYLSINWMF